MYVRRTLEAGYPPRSPWFSLLRRLAFPAPTLLLRRMEIQLLALLGELHAAGNWAMIAAEHRADHRRRPGSSAATGKAVAVASYEGCRSSRRR